MQHPLPGKMSRFQNMLQIKIIKDFKMNIDDFPEVKERIMKNGMRYFLGRNLYKKQDQRDFLTLDRIEDLLVGIK